MWLWKIVSMVVCCDWTVLGLHQGDYHLVSLVSLLPLKLFLW